MNEEAGNNIAHKKYTFRVESLSVQCPVTAKIPKLFGDVHTSQVQLITSRLGSLKATLNSLLIPPYILITWSVNASAFTSVR